MASLRKASAYSKKHVVPYTRTSKLKGKAYIKTVPPQKIVKFLMGLGKEFPHKLSVVAKERAQIRDNALESCRQLLNKKLDQDLTGQYRLRIPIFPHHIQRENKMITGAGADRMQTGMQLSYGKSAGKAALVKEGTPIFIMEVATPKAVQFARKLIKQIKPKLPCKIKVLYEEKGKIVTTS